MLTPFSYFKERNISFLPQILWETVQGFLGFVSAWIKLKGRSSDILIINKFINEIKLIINFMAKRLEECLSAQAFMTDGHRLGGLNKKNLFLHSVRGWKSKTKVPADSGAGEDCSS